jgi:hypothetical protein
MNAAGADAGVGGPDVPVLRTDIHARDSVRSDGCVATRTGCALLAMPDGSLPWIKDSRHNGLLRAPGQPRVSTVRYICEPGADRDIVEITETTVCVYRVCPKCWPGVRSSMLNLVAFFFAISDQSLPNAGDCSLRRKYLIR